MLKGYVLRLSDVLSIKAIRATNRESEVSYLCLYSWVLNLYLLSFRSKFSSR